MMADVDPLTVVAGVAVLAGAALQAATGFGFGLVAAPLLFAAVPSQEAVGLVTVLGVLLNLLTLGSERRRPQPLAREVLGLLAWSVPGLFVGVLLLRSLDAMTLQIIVTAGVLSSLAIRRIRPPERAVPRWALPAVGVVSGGLATATTTAGPPIVLYLLLRRVSPVEVRDTLSLTFLGLGFLGAAALAVTGTTGAIPDGGTLAVLAGLVVAGHLLGRRAFRWLADGRYEAALTGVLVISAVAGLLTVVL